MKKKRKLTGIYKAIKISFLVLLFLGLIWIFLFILNSKNNDKEEGLKTLKLNIQIKSGKNLVLEFGRIIFYMIILVLILIIFLIIWMLIIEKNKEFYSVKKSELNILEKEFN